jgi:membrane protein DedA with SNARE-associated domain
MTTAIIIALAVIGGWVAYLIGHMSGAAAARRLALQQWIAERHMGAAGEGRE